MARLLMLLGVGLFAVGALLYFAPGALQWFGRLPGDIRIESEKGRIFIPITSMLIVSVVLSVLMSILKR